MDKLEARLEVLVRHVPQLTFDLRLELVPEFLERVEGPLLPLLVLTMAETELTQQVLQVRVQEGDLPQDQGGAGERVDLVGKGPAGNLGGRVCGRVRGM